MTKLAGHGWGMKTTPPAISMPGRCEGLLRIFGANSLTGHCLWRFDFRNVQTKPGFWQERYWKSRFEIGENAVPTRG